MRITNTMLTSDLVSQIQNLNSEQAQLQGEVGTGLAITQPSDNPAGMDQVLQLENQSSQLVQYGNNANSALQVVQSSYGGLNALVQTFDRASELGALGQGAQATGTMQQYASEADELVQQALQVANTQSGSEYLFGGSATTSAPFTATLDGSGQIASVAYVGNSQQVQIPISSTASISPWTSGTTNSGMADFINNLISLRDALQNGDPNALASANTALTTSENVLTNAVADNGAVQARILSDQTQQQSGITEINSQISSLADVNLPSTIVELNQAQLAYQASMQTAAQVMQLSLLNYIH